MVKLTNGPNGVDCPDVVFFARDLAVRAGVRNPYRQAVAIRNWLSRVWRFVDDPPDRELLMTPDVALERFNQTGVIAGDCDEAAMLGAALGKSIGLNAVFVVLSFPALEDPTVDIFQHVFAVLLTPFGDSVSLDVTRPRGPVPQPIRAASVDV